MVSFFQIHFKTDLCDFLDLGSIFTFLEVRNFFEKNQNQWNS